MNEDTDPRAGLLAPPAVGDQVPGGWEGRPAWFTVVEVLGPASYLIECPDGSRNEMRDTD